MVSTRRTALNISEPDTASEAGHALRKKPVRKASAKADPERPVTRATRARKGHSVLDSEQAGHGTSTDVENTQRATRSQPAVRKASVRSKDMTRPPPPRGDVSIPTKATKPYRNAVTRPKEPDVLVQEPIGDLIPEQIECASTRVTRRTRAEVAKAMPLSPKKISQISKRHKRDAKLAEKEVIDARAGEEVAKKRSTTRRRAVSDENNDLDSLAKDTKEEAFNVSISKESTKNRSPLRAPRRNTKLLRSESPMSSRPTTPSQSPVPSFRDEQDSEQEPDEEIDNEDDVMDDEPQAHKHLDISDDELAGPKTPMKRSSPGAQARYFTSVHRTIRRLDDKGGVHSPLDDPGSTPKNVKLATGSASCLTATQQPIVDLTNDEACSLQKSPVHSEVEMTEETIVMEDTHDEDEVEHEAENQDGFPRVDDSLLLDTPYRTRRVSSILDSPSTENAIVQCETSEASEAGIEIDEARDHDIEMTGDEQDCDLGRTALHDLSGISENNHADGSLIYDSDDTVAKASAENDIPPNLSEIDNPMIEINQAFPIAPETLVWENIRDDITIPIDFDKHFAEVRYPLRMDQTRCLSDAMDLTPALACGNENEEDENSLGFGKLCINKVEDMRDSIFAGNRRTTLDTFNEFVDVDAFDRQTEANNDDDRSAGPSTPSSKAGRFAVPVSLQPARESRVQNRLCYADLDDGEDSLPRYANTTIAFRARRKSLPATVVQTPLKCDTRPHTSDGASMPRLGIRDRQAWWARAASAHATPIRPQSRIGLGRTSTLPHSKSRRPSFSCVNNAPSPVRPGSRQSRLSVHHKHANTAAPSRRFRTPVSTPAKRPSTSHKPDATVETPYALSLRPRRIQTPEVRDDAPTVRTAQQSPSDVSAVAEVVTPFQSPSERVQQLPSRRKHEALARTVAAPRHRTPMRSPLKRPVTSARPAPSRKVTFSAHTPATTPLKAVAMTPGQAPMTPHPNAPLRDVVALVEVFTLDGASASAAFAALLQRLGARTQKSWSERITHVVFKDGSPRTLQKLRLHNQAVAEGNRAGGVGVGVAIHCVNSRWVSDCDAAGRRLPEADDAYAVDPAVVPRGGSRRRKSMEPYALLHIGGNVVRADHHRRKSSLGRASLGAAAKSPARRTSLAEDLFRAATPREKRAAAASMEQENRPLGFGGEEYDEEEEGDEATSPATPAWLHPEQLVQQTAPLNRVRKFELGKGEAEKARKRRLTFWVGQGKQ
nr:microcephalin [Quercus suber]